MLHKRERLTYEREQELRAVSEELRTHLGPDGQMDTDDDVIELLLHEVQELRIERAEARARLSVYTQTAYGQSLTPKLDRDRDTIVECLRETAAEIVRGARAAPDGGLAAVSGVLTTLLEINDGRTVPLTVERGKFRVRKLLHQNGVEAEAGVVLESTGQLNDWLIVSYDDSKWSSRQVRHLNKVMHERFGDKVLVLRSDIEFAVFERVE